MSVLTPQFLQCICIKIKRKKKKKEIWKEENIHCFYAVACHRNGDTFHIMGGYYVPLAFSLKEHDFQKWRW